MRTGCVERRAVLFGVRVFSFLIVVIDEELKRRTLPALRVFQHRYIAAGKHIAAGDERPFPDLPVDTHRLAFLVVDGVERRKAPDEKASALASRLTLHFAPDHALCGNAVDLMGEYA